MDLAWDDPPTSSTERTICPLFVSDLFSVSVQQENICSLEGISSHFLQWHGNIRSSPSPLISSVTLAFRISASFALTHHVPSLSASLTLISTLSLYLSLSFGQVTAFRELRTNRTPTLLTYVSRAIFHQKALWHEAANLSDLTNTHTLYTVYWQFNSPPSCSQSQTRCNRQTWDDTHAWTHTQKTSPTVAPLRSCWWWWWWQWGVGVTSKAVPMATYRWLTSRWCSCRDNLQCVASLWEPSEREERIVGVCCRGCSKYNAADRSTDETQQTESTDDPRLGD